MNIKIEGAEGLNISDIKDEQDDEQLGLKSNRKSKKIVQSGVLYCRILNQIVDNRKQFFLTIFCISALFILIQLIQRHFNDKIVPQCFSLQNHSKNALLLQSQSNDCSDGCLSCWKYQFENKIQRQNISQCVSCQKGYLYFNKTCVQTCPDKYKEDYLSRICIPQYYSHKNVTRQLLRSQVIQGLELGYNSFKNFEHPTQIIFALNHALNNQVINYSSISNFQRVLIIELDVPLPFILSFEQGCGKNLFSSVFLSEFLPKMLMRHEFKELSRVTFMGFNQTSLLALELALQVKQLQISSKANYIPPEYLWVHLMTENFISNAISIDQFSPSYSLWVNNLKLESYNLKTFLSSQIFVPPINFLHIDIQQTIDNDFIKQLNSAGLVIAKIILVNQQQIEQPLNDQLNHLEKEQQYPF